jgi:hypothetical protein
MNYLTQRRRDADRSDNLHFLCASAPRRDTSFTLIAAITIGVFTPLSAVGQQGDPPPFAAPGDESVQFTVDTAHGNLDNPIGLALRPGAPDSGPFELYYSESGAGRVVRFSTDKPADASPVVTDFPTSSFQRGDEYLVGPLGLAFLSRMKLAVGVGSAADDPLALGVYNLPNDGQPIDFGAAVGDASLPSRENAQGGERYFSLARTEGALLIAASDAAGAGGVLKASIDANKLSGLRRLTRAPSEESGLGVLGVTITPNPRATYLLAAQMGELGEQRDSRITFYAPGSGAVALQLQAGVRDAVALAYSPTGDLYVADAAWDDPAAGGVYRIDAAEIDGRQSCRPVKIAAAQRPTSLAFTADGTLYVTAFGDRDDSNAPPTGALLKITPKEGTSPL